MEKKSTNHLNFLFDISELTDIVTSSPDTESFLTHAVKLIARHLNAHVCSIYLFDTRNDRLVLKATKGLNPDAVNTISMVPGQGLVGHCFDQMCVIREGNASKNPKFKYFSEAGEDPFNSFLCVPIKWGYEKIGVIVVQHKNMDYFTQPDETALKTAVAQLANAIENARLLMALSQDTTSIPHLDTPQLLKGDTASPGTAMGCARPIENTKNELKQLQHHFAEILPESASLIFTAHFMILKDKNFIGKMMTMIDEGTPPFEAVRQVAISYIDIFKSSSNDYIKEKALDVEDLSIRLLLNFSPIKNASDPGEGMIIIAKELYPSDVLKLVSNGASGIILISSGVTSHVAILSRSLKIPMIIASDNRLLMLPEDTQILLDGYQGNIYINPADETIDLFKTQSYLKNQADDLDIQDKTLTKDGQRIKLLANINLLNEVETANKLKAEGIGLYRTEFPFLIRNTFPSETEQHIIYKKLFNDFGNTKPITIRTLDVGGEKALSYAGQINEANPELGLRSIRFSLKHRDVFESQINAILRAASGKDNIKIMFPLISSLDEFFDAKEMIFQCMTSLKTEGIEYNRSPEIGMMIELPSVLGTIDEFAKAADFFSIGTNDFIQYMLAADRSNRLVSDYYVPLHPAVIRGLDKIVKAAHAHHIDVTVCGEMAHEPEYIPFLIGIGLRSFSVDPRYIASIQHTIASLDLMDTRQFAAELLTQTTISGIQEVVLNFNDHRGC